MALTTTCDGMRRRDFLKAGAIGATGLSLASYLQLVQAGEVAPGKAQAGILVYLAGGPSHMDTFDLKPDAPQEFRGEFKPIKTNVAGVEISEHLPKLAQHADKFAVLRGVSHTLAAHQLGREYMNTGNRPIPSLVYPGYASVASSELANVSDLPKAVSIPNAPHQAGYLGVAHNPLSTGGVPKPGQPFAVRGMGLRGLTVTDVERRHKLLEDLDTTFASHDSSASAVAGLDKFSDQAYAIISSPRARDAFDISREKADVAREFGDSGFAQSCLLATRLVEAGVRFVTIELGGWDTHAMNFQKLKDNLLPQLDAGMSGLFDQLAKRGLLPTTSVMMTGEFGRTPKVNTKAGRDHYPRAMTVLVGGGGMRCGQVIGASDDKGTGPLDRTITPDAVAASFYHSLGIDYRKEFHTGTGRPVMLVRNGEIIPELFG